MRLLTGMTITTYVKSACHARGISSAWVRHSNIRGGSQIFVLVPHQVALVSLAGIFWHIIAATRLSPLVERNNGCVFLWNSWFDSESLQNNIFRVQANNVEQVGLYASVPRGDVILYVTHFVVWCDATCVMAACMPW